MGRKVGKGDETAVEYGDFWYLLLMEEILHQLIGSLSHFLQGLIHPRWCMILSINSMLDF